MNERIRLRKVLPRDLPLFFEHQKDPVAAKMAEFPSRERPAFDAHWALILANDSGLIRTILCDGRVAGNVLSFEQQGVRLVGYWIGREYWGKGIATRALAAFVRRVETRRPLLAHVATHNGASRRVLEKCGFTLLGEQAGDFVLQLDRGRRRVPGALPAGVH